MIPMTKIVISCLNPTFAYLNLPPDDTTDIQIKSEPFSGTQLFWDNHVILTGDDMLKNLGDIIKDTPIYPTVNRYFRVIGPNPKDFYGPVCKTPVHQCQILRHAVENNSGVVINIDRRTDNSGCFNYRVELVVLPKLTIDESIKAYQQVCTECAKRNTCATKGGITH